MTPTGEPPPSLLPEAADYPRPARTNGLQHFPYVATLGEDHADGGSTVSALGHFRHAQTACPCRFGSDTRVAMGPPGLEAPCKAGFSAPGANRGAMLERPRPDGAQVARAIAAQLVGPGANAGANRDLSLFALGLSAALARVRRAMQIARFGMLRSGRARVATDVVLVVQARVRTLGVALDRRIVVASDVLGITWLSGDIPSERGICTDAHDGGCAERDREESPLPHFLSPFFDDAGLAPAATYPRRNVSSTALASKRSWSRAGHRRPHGPPLTVRARRKQGTDAPQGVQRTRRMPPPRGKTFSGLH